MYMIIQIFLQEPTSNSFVICPGVELLNHMVIHFKFFIILFSIAVAPFYTFYQQCTRVVYILINTCCFFFLNSCICFKDWDKAKLSTLTTSSQRCAGSPRQYKKQEKEIKVIWKEKCKAVVIHRHDCVCGKS